MAKKKEQRAKTGASEDERRRTCSSGFHHVADNFFCLWSPLASFGVPLGAALPPARDSPWLPPPPPFSGERALSSRHGSAATALPNPSLPCLKQK